MPLMHAPLDQHCYCHHVGYWPDANIVCSPINSGPNKSLYAPLEHYSNEPVMNCLYNFILRPKLVDYLRPQMNMMFESQDMQPSCWQIINYWQPRESNQQSITTHRSIHNQRVMAAASVTSVDLINGRTVSINIMASWRNCSDLLRLILI